MKDEELLEKANLFIIEHETDESALASVALWNLLKKVRLETARAAAEECRQVWARSREDWDYDHGETREQACIDCASAIRARFGVEP